MFGNGRIGLPGEDDGMLSGSLFGSNLLGGNFLYGIVRKMFGLGSTEKAEKHEATYIVGRHMEKCSDMCTFKKDISFINSVAGAHSLKFEDGSSKAYYSIEITKPLDFQQIFNSQKGCFGGKYNFICSECASKADLLCQMNQKNKTAEDVSSPTEYVLTASDGISYLLKDSNPLSNTIEKYMISKLKTCEDGSYSEEPDAPISLFEAPLLSSFKSVEGACLLGMNSKKSEELEEEKNPKE